MSDEEQEQPAGTRDATPRQNTEESQGANASQLQNTSEGSVMCSDAEFDGNEGLFIVMMPEIKHICFRAQATTASKIQKSKLQLFPVIPHSPPRLLIATTTRTPAIIVERNSSPSRASLFKTKETEENIVQLKFYEFKQIEDCKKMFTRLACVERDYNTAIRTYNHAKAVLKRRADILKDLREKEFKKRKQRDRWIDRFGHPSTIRITRPANSTSSTCGAGAPEQVEQQLTQEPRIIKTKNSKETEKKEPSQA